MKKLLALLLVFVLVFSLAACSNGNENAQQDQNETVNNSGNTADSSNGNENADTSSGEELTKIGWSTDILSSNFTSGLATSLQSLCDERGIELEIQDANRDMNLQINQVENMISNGCQVIILKPYDMSACAPISTACAEAGIPLVVICSDITSDYDCAVMVSNEDIGRMKAEAIVEALDGEGNVAILNGTLSQQGWVEQADAAKALFAEYPGITVVDEQVAENNDQANAITVAENWITAGVDIDAIWCSQDTVAMGAGTSFQEAGLEAYIVGQGGMEDAQVAIKNGTLDATIYLPSSVYMTGAIQAAEALFAGESIEKDMYMELELLTSDNIDTFVFN